MVEGSTFQQGQGGMQMAWWWGCNLGSHGWRAGGPVLSPSSVTTRPQRSRDRICSGPLCSNFLVKGWSSLCSRKENKMLSSGCARPGSIRDASIAMTRIVHYWFSAFCVLPLTVLTAVGRGEGTSLSQQLCLHRQSPMGGAGQGSQAWDRLPLQ